MESQEYLTNSFSDDGQLTNNEMQSVYTALSVSDNTDIDTQETFTLIDECIQEAFDKSFLLIDKEKLQSNGLLLNKQFVTLIKVCNVKINFKNVGMIFIEFCDYFDLDAVKVYKELHEKLQRLIQINTRKMVGEKRYQKVKEKNNEHPELHITSLFDLVHK